MRKLATVEVIKEILPHTNADALELAIVRGWQVVVKKGDFKAGDPVLYFEVDSWVPHELAPFLSKGNEPSEYEGAKGERLRTVKLRGEISQGLVLPVREFDGMLFVLPYGETIAHAGNMRPVYVGDDVTEILGVLKWESPINPQLAGQVKGNFPSFIKKTEQERCQNCYDDMAFLDNHQHGGIDWIMEEKMDGCLTDAAMISTNKGYVSISEIVDNHQNYKVKTYNVNDETIEFSDIVNVMKNPNDGKQWYRLTLEDERVIDITGNHKVYLPKLRCWRRVDELEENDIFLIE